jgi:hypothetical protein
MKTPEEIYDSLCKRAQELNDILDDLRIPLKPDQVENLIREIGRAQKKIEDYSKNQHHR